MGLEDQAEWFVGSTLGLPLPLTPPFSSQRLLALLGLNGIIDASQTGTLSSERMGLIFPSVRSSKCGSGVEAHPSSCERLGKSSAAVVPGSCYPGQQAASASAESGWSSKWMTK